MNTREGGGKRVSSNDSFGSQVTIVFGSQVTIVWVSSNDSVDNLLIVIHTIGLS